MTDLWDVIVIGGGPAGSTTAYRLSQAGYRVLILEKEVMPREKMCGGVVSKRALTYLDFTLPKHLINRNCKEMRVFYRESSAVVTLAHPFSILTTRSQFDNYLLQKALSVDVHLKYEEVCSLWIEEDEGRVVVETAYCRYYARMTVIATGVVSRLSRSVRRKDLPHEVGFCLAQNYYSGDGNSRANHVSEVNIYFGLIDCGYAWLFDHGAFRSVGIGGMLSRQKKPLESMRAFWRSLDYPLSDLNPTGCFFPIGGIQRQLIRSRIILAGDAAGFSDPFSGEGIAYAIRSGQVAAHTAEEALSKGKFSALDLSTYIDEVNKQFGSELSVALWISKVTHRFPGIFLRLSLEPDVLTRYLKTVMGDSSYSEFYSWMLMRMPYLLLKNRIKSLYEPGSY